jgi:leucyl-tRNA synthetase
MPITESDAAIDVFTTRIDTAFGITYIVVAPEHPVINSIRDRLTNREQVDEYIKSANLRSELERMEASIKTGVQLEGISVINPFNQEIVPVFVADYVLGHYGTGAIMAVPAHDDRDLDFAKKYNLPIREVVKSRDSKNDESKKAFTSDGLLVNSGIYSGMTSGEAREAMAEWLKNTGIGRNEINYKIRDWLVSRQRYWGAPIPIICCTECGNVPVPEKDLPVLLPSDVDFRPTGESPLVYSKSFHEVSCPQCGKPARRESETLDTFICSSWYFFRYTDPKNKEEFASEDNIKKWFPVDFYIGGSEHATGHLIYARFITKVLRKFGYIDFDEPFPKLRHQGMVMGEAEFSLFVNEDGTPCSVTELRDIKEDSGATGGFLSGINIKTGKKIFSKTISHEETEKIEGYFCLKSDLNIRVDKRSFKMSKSKGNVINPNEMVDKFGADSLRLYEMFMGPLEEDSDWNSEGILGLRRFLERIWRCGDNLKDVQMSESIDSLMHKTIRKVTVDIESLQFNTAISALMVFLRGLEREKNVPKEAFKIFLRLLSPLAPHISEELWENIGHNKSISFENWPVWDEEKCKEKTVEIVVQVDGRVITRFPMSSEDGIDQEKVEMAALCQPKLKSIHGKEIFKKIFIPGKIFNFVVTGREEK